jgi:hypothetical protein
VSYENLERFFPKREMVLSGNPVRQDLLGIESKSRGNSVFQPKMRAETYWFLEVLGQEE